MQVEKRFLTLSDVGKRYGVSYQTVYGMARSGRIPAFQIGGTGAWRVDLELLEQAERRALRRR